MKRVALSRAQTCIIVLNLNYCFIAINCFPDVLQTGIHWFIFPCFLYALLFYMHGYWLEWTEHAH